MISLSEQVRELDKLIEDRFHRHELAPVIESMPGIGPVLGAEFLAAAGGDMSFFGTPDRLAGFAGLAPAPRDSGRIRGNLHRPERCHRGLNRVFYHSTMASITCSEESRIFYDRKRGEGKRHTQAVVALARRRVNVLWALIRDKRPYQPRPPSTPPARPPPDNPTGKPPMQLDKLIGKPAGPSERPTLNAQVSIGFEVFWVVAARLAVWLRSGLSYGGVSPELRHGCATLRQSQGSRALPSDADCRQDSLAVDNHLESGIEIRR